MSLVALRMLRNFVSRSTSDMGRIIEIANSYQLSAKTFGWMIAKLFIHYWQLKADSSVH